MKGFFSHPYSLSHDHSCKVSQKRPWDLACCLVPFKSLKIGTPKITIYPKSRGIRIAQRWSQELRQLRYEPGLFSAGLEVSLSSTKNPNLFLWVFVSLLLQFLNLYLQVSSHKAPFTNVYITQFATFMLFGYYLGHREALHGLSVLL